MQTPPRTNLLLNGTPVPVIEETKLLSVIFVLAHTSWGADQETLLHLYRSLIRSKLDYGCVVYGSTRIFWFIIVTA